MKTRPLGATGHHLSLLGFGGIAVNGLDPAEASRLVAESVDHGVNYFDSSPTYGDSEVRLGRALQPYRDQVFLAGKTNRRTRAEAAARLEASLRDLRTEHLDLYQVHEIDTREEVETVFAPGGAMEAFEAARRAGRIRLIGFSTHSVEVALEMLRRYPFDTLLFPFTFASWYRGFGPQVMRAAQARGTARLGIKALVRGRWPEGVDPHQQAWWYQPAEAREEADLALRFALSLDVTAVVSPGLPHLLRLAREIADRFTPLTPEEEARLQALSQQVTPLFPYAKPEAEKERDA